MNKCAHCEESGTCRNGENGTSCAVCLKEQKVKNGIGLVCSVCGGLGIAESKTQRIRNRIVPILAILIVYISLTLVFVFASEDNFSEILAFAGTLIGSITGYYFGGKNSKDT